MVFSCRRFFCRGVGWPLNGCQNHVSGMDIVGLGIVGDLLAAVFAASVLFLLRASHPIPAFLWLVLWLVYWRPTLSTYTR